MGTALVVDDSKTDLSMVSTYLQQNGLQVMTASSGEEALACLASQKPDIIILDVVLPGRSGFELCRELKNEAATSNIPIIIYSTKCTEMDRFWGMKQGANAYLGKPVDPAELGWAVKQLIVG